MDISSLPAQVMNCGHEASEENIYLHKTRNGREYYRCGECRRIRDRERYNRGKPIRFELHCKCGCVVKASVPQETLVKYQGDAKGMYMRCGTCNYGGWVGPVDGK